MADLISVDWDFFTLNRWHEDVETKQGTMPGLLVYDWQMDESRPAMLDNIVWVSRASTLRHMGLDPVEATRVMMDPEIFASDLSLRWDFASVPAWQANSHGWMGVLGRQMSEIHEPLTVFNFDAHHDLGYNEAKALANYGKQQFECDDWAYYGLRAGFIKRFVQVYPDWLGRAEWENRERPWLDPFKDRIEVKTWSEFLTDYTDEREDLAASFLCRSSSWTPPWQDEAFEALVGEFGFFVDCLDCIAERRGGGKNYDACEQREWSWESVREQDELRDKVLALGKKADA
jgi:hypothetical protein